MLKLKFFSKFFWVMASLILFENNLPLEATLDGSWSSLQAKCHEICQGLPGPIGPQGPAGPKGSQGPTGGQGDEGADGAVGPRGRTGPTGGQGEIGLDGPFGPIGPTGFVGPAGIDGATGAQGLEGGTGGTGPTGPMLNQAFLSYGFFNSSVVQTNIPTGGTVSLENAILTSGGYVLTLGGVSIPNTGIYEIYYQLMASEVSSTIINFSVSPITFASQFGTNVAGGYIAGSFITPLNAGEVVTITNSGSTTFSTVATSSTVNPAIPVAMVILQLR